MRYTILAAILFAIVVVSTCTYIRLKHATEGQSTMQPFNGALPGQQKNFPGATESQILAYESAFKVKLPTRYRHFLKTINGGTFGDCNVETYRVNDGLARPAPKNQWLQDLRTLALPKDHPMSLFHDDGFLDVIREDEDVLIQIGSMVDAGLLYVYVTPDKADEIWLKTPDLPTYDGKQFNLYASEWFFMDENIYEFLKRLRCERDK